jgi:hypothetical protein
MDLLKPNKQVMMETPATEYTKTGLRPTRSERRPQEIMKIICVREKSDS